MGYLFQSNMVREIIVVKSLILVPFSDTRPFNDFRIRCVGIDIAVCLMNISKADIDILIHRSVLVEQTVRKEPVVSLSQVENACWCAVVASFQPFISQTAVII